MLPTRPPLRLALAVVLAGASAGLLLLGGGRDGEASCAAVIEYGGHTYFGGGRLKRDPATTGRIVDGVLPVCDDSGGQDPPVGPEETVRVAELEGVPLDTAFLWMGDIYLRRGHRLPAATKIWFRGTALHHRRGVRPHRRLARRHRPEEGRGSTATCARRTGSEVHVTEGPRDYVGTTIQVRADAATEPALGPSRREGVALAGRTGRRAGAVCRRPLPGGLARGARRAS